jgi:hypothetical protein
MYALPLPVDSGTASAAVVTAYWHTADRQIMMSLTIRPGCLSVSIRYIVFISFWLSSKHELCHEHDIVMIISNLRKELG